MKNSILSFIILLTLSVIAFGQEGVPKPTPEAGPVKISYGIAVDSSGSYRMIIEKVIKVVKDVVAENKEGDETFLVSFVSTDKIKIVQDLTGSKEELDDAIDNIYVQGGETAILDALYSSAQYLAENVKAENGRKKVLIVISDGDERKSATKYEALAKYLKDENISVFAVGLAEKNLVFPKLLSKITKDTGGKLYMPTNAAETADAVRSITADIRNR